MKFTIMKGHPYQVAPLLRLKYMNVICLNDAISKLNANIVDIWGKTLIV